MAREPTTSGSRNVKSFEHLDLRVCSVDCVGLTLLIARSEAWLQEAHQLWNELKKLKAGTPLRNSGASASSDAPAATVATTAPDTDSVSAESKPDVEVVDLSMTMLPEEPEDPVIKAARDKSLEEMDRIHLFTEKTLLFEELRQKMSPTTKLSVLIDAQTSRSKVNLDYLEAVREFVRAAGRKPQATNLDSASSADPARPKPYTGLARYTVCIIIGQRTGSENLIAFHDSVGVAV